LLEEILKGVRNGSNILSVPPPAVARVRHSDPSRESSFSVSQSQKNRMSMLLDRFLFMVSLANSIGTVLSMSNNVGS
jgi:hypothetical protein